MFTFDTFIGIDPGKDGGFAVINQFGASTNVWDNEGFIVLMKAMSSANAFTFIELVSAFPGQGVTSMFNFGKSAGYIEGVLAALRMSYQLIPSQKWKKEFSLGGDKANSIEVCERLFPGVNLFRTDRCKKKHDGMAEALLIAEYARRRHTPMTAE